jgi:hypothetical protein
MTTRAVREIQNRFEEEAAHIREYVEVLQNKHSINEEMVVDLNEDLKIYRLGLLPRRDPDRYEQPYSLEERAALSTGVREALEEVGIEVYGFEERQTEEPELLSTPTGAGVKHFDLYVKWTRWMLPRLSLDPTAEQREKLLERARTVEKNNPEPGLTPQTADDVIQDALHWACVIKARCKRSTIWSIQERLRELAIAARVANPDAEINLLRQGFLLLMTAFDAAVFDLLRIAFKERFFQLVGLFGGNDKWSMEDIAGAGSFAAMEAQIIETQLKKRYIKDLLNVLDDLGVSCVDASKGDRFVNLIELVQRRNIHVHNRGVVDERYLESDPKTGKAKYNLFNLKLGDAACIDSLYLETANRLCTNCVEQFAAWVKAN